MERGVFLKYISDLNIKTFKGIEEVQINNLGDMNIFVGDNNTCKTTVLEAIQLFQNPNSIRELLKIVRKRDINLRRPGGLSVMESFLNMFNAGQDEDKHVEIKCTLDGREENIVIKGTLREIYMLTDEIEEISKYQRYTNIRNEINEDEPVQEFIGELRYNKSIEEISINEVVDVYRHSIKSQKSESIKTVKMKYVSSIDHLNESFSSKILKDTIINDEKSSLLNLISLFDEDIIGLELLPGKRSRYTTVYLKHKKYGFLPLSSFGDGIKKVLTLASAVLSSKNGILLIDEIETAIHTSALESVFEWLLRASKELNVQIFATTHSDEALRALLRESKNTLFDVSIYRLEKFRNEIIPRHFSSEKAYDIVINNGGDLR